MIRWLRGSHRDIHRSGGVRRDSKISGDTGNQRACDGLALDITSAEFPELDDRQAETAESQWLADNC